MVVKPPPKMNHKPLPQDDSWESDAVWKLLDQAAPKTAGPRFTDDTVRAARLAGQERTAWWQRLMAPLPLGSLAASAAAITITLIALKQPASELPIADGNPTTSEEPFAEVQKLAEEEYLSAAVDHLDDFTDSELVCLIGL